MSLFEMCGLSATSGLNPRKVNSSFMGILCTLHLHSVFNKMTSVCFTDTDREGSGEPRVPRGCNAAAVYGLKAA